MDVLGFALTLTGSVAGLLLSLWLLSGLPAALLAARRGAGLIAPFVMLLGPAAWWALALHRRHEDERVRALHGSVV